jgi:hypothetical protein
LPSASCPKPLYRRRLIRSKLMVTETNELFIFLLLRQSALRRCSKIALTPPATYPA